MSSIMKGLVDEQDIEETKKLSAQEKFKRGMARAGYDMDAGAKRLQDLLDKQKKEREELEKKEQKDVSEDATLQFAAEITPTVNPHAGIKDRKFRGAIGEGIKRMFEEPNYSPTDAGYQQGGWRKMNEEEVSEDLRKWFKEKWVRFGPDGKIRGACARGSSSEGKPKCLPQAKAHALGKKGRKYAAAKKRREDPNPERSGPAKNVATKKKSKSESINEGLWDWIKDKLSNKKPIQWSENYYDFIIRNDPLYLQAYLNAVKNDPNYIEWKKNNPNAAQQSTSQTNYTGSQNRPEQYQSGDDFTAPHGSSENELKMFVNGTKPAAIVPEPNFSSWAKVINSGKYWTKQLISNGKLHSIIIVQPGNEESGKQIYELVQNAMNLANQGDFRAYENSNYHRRLGKLLGYPKDKIEQWINNYFKDKVDLAKTKIDEQDLNETFDQPYKLKWYPSDMDEVTAYAEIPNGDDLSIMFNLDANEEGEEAWAVEFYRNSSQEVTGEGDAQRIFATVLSAIKTFIKKYKPNRITFSASKDNWAKQQQGSYSRANLYDRLVQRYASTLGYKAFRADTGDKVIYELSKIAKQVAEGSGKNVVKSVKVGNFRHDLVDTGMGWQVRIYNGDELYDTGMSKNSEQKGLAALEDAVAYTEKQTRTKRQGVAEGFSDISGLLSASNLNKSFIITAELAEGGKKKFRVKAQNEKVAIEKFEKHHSMAKIINVKEEGVEEGSEEALKFASQAHAGQKRSGGDPYITHPMRVADHIRKYKQSHNLDALISAAYLHDTIEDTDTTHEVLHDLFGGLVASLVKELTSDPDKIKKLGKAEYLAKKMAAMSSYALVIKLADRLDNVKDITTAKTPEWRQKYKKETEHILNYIEKSRALSGTHNKLIQLIRDKLSEIDDMKEGSKYPKNPASYHLKKYPVPQDQLAKPVKKEPKKPEKKPDEKLDELKCWSGYTRVKGVPAGAPGSCKKKTNEEHQQCPECGGAMYEVSLMNEKKDACYYKVKSRYKVWPSAYASGALVKCRKKGASNWGNKSKSNEGQIYSTGGGAGQSYRYYTPKDNLGESNILKGISRVDEGLKSQLAGAALAAAMAAGGAQADNTRRVVPQADGTMSPSFATQLASASQQLSVVKPLPNNFEQIVYKGMKGVRDKDDGTIVLIGKAPNSVQVIRVENNKEVTDYMDINELGNETKQALSLIIGKSDTQPLGKPTPGVNVDRQQNTINYNGKEYNIVKINKNGPQPRINRFDAKVQVTYPDLGIRSMGVANVTLAGDTAYAYVD